MVISETELRDIGLTHNIMMSRFKHNKPVYIGYGAYIVTDIINNFTGSKTYRLRRKPKED